MKHIIFTIAPCNYTSKKSGEISHVTHVTIAVEGEQQTMTWYDFKVKVFMPCTYKINPTDIDLKAEHVSIGGYAIPWNYIFGLNQMVQYCIENNAK